MTLIPPIYNVRSLWVRKVTTLVAGLGLSLGVFVFASAIMLGQGIQKTMVATGSPGNAKIIRKGSQNEVQSGVTPEQVRLLSAAQEVGMGKDGKPLSSAELIVLIFAQKDGAKSSDEGANVNVRGVGPSALELHPPLSVNGRQWKSGTSEVMVGKALVGKFEGARLGGTIHFARRDWAVVGVMDQGGSAYDSEVWGDIEQFSDAFNRRPNVSSVTLRLADANAVGVLQARMETDPQLNKLECKREDAFWAAQSRTTSLFISILGIFVAVIFSFGATLGAMITMYAQVAARTREVGMLRAIGFSRGAVLASFVLESLILAMGAGVFGVFCASFWSFASFSTINFATFSETTFRFAMTPSVIGYSFFFASMLGLVGGFLPAVRAARLPIIAATKGG